VDLVMRPDGTKLSGRIQGCDDEALILAVKAGEQRVPLADIAGALIRPSLRND
jgi:ribosome maturation factor RimP